MKDEDIEKRLKQDGQQRVGQVDKHKILFQENANQQVQKSRKKLFKNKRFIVTIAASLILVIGLSIGLPIGLWRGGDQEILNRPSYAGYRIGDKTVFDNNITAKNINAQKSKHVQSLKANINTGDFDEIVNTNESFEIDFIVRNPEKDTILSVTVDDSIQGLERIYTSQSQKYHIKDITTEYDEERQDYFTYVKAIITGTDQECERVITVQRIEFLRDVIREVVNGEAIIPTNNNIKTVNVFTKIPAETLTISSGEIHLDLNQSIQLTHKYFPDNTSLSDVKYSLVSDTKSMVINDSGLITCVRNDLVEEIEIIAECDGVKSNILTLYPKVLISSAEDFLNIYESGFYLINNDLDFSGLDIKVFYSTCLLQYFYGVIDGQNNKFLNLTMDNAIGMFMWNHGTIKNIIIDNAIVILSERYSATGVLVAANEGMISRCKVSGVVDISAVDTQYDGFGGIALTNYPNGIIEKCEANLTFLETRSTVGGIADTNRGIIRNCVSTLNSIDKSVGGISYHNNGLIENCFSLLPAFDFSGSICAYQDNAGSIKNCLSVFSKYIFFGDKGSYENNWYFQTNELENADAKTAKLATLENVNDFLFYTVTLKWSVNDWDFSSLSFADALYPKLK